MKRAFFYLLCTLFSYPLLATEHFFLEIKKDGIEIGKYQGDKFREKKLFFYSFDHINEKEVAKTLLGEDSAQVLYYFHSMWGGVRPYHKNSLKILNNLNGPDRIVSLVWHTDAIGYKASWEMAINQGRALANLFEHLTSYKKQEHMVLCHSMGHRLLEGIVVEMKGKGLFDTVVLAGADLDLGVFQGNLDQLSQISRKTVVYIHEKDRLLQLSRVVHRCERLGLKGEEHRTMLKDVSNLEVVDVSSSTGWSNHIYFKSHFGVRQDIDYLLTGQENERKKHLMRKSGNYFLLN